MLFLFKTLVRWRKFILISTFFVAIITAVVSLLLTQWFTATTSIFPPETQANLPIYTELMQSLQAPLFGPIASGVRPETIYIDMMKSRTVGERLIEEFDLYDVFKVSLVEDALNQLGQKLGFTLVENGLLVVSYEDRDPERAAAVANRIVELLDEFNRELNVSRASKTRQFIESQLEKREASLSEAELALKVFQETHQALDLDEQLRTAMMIVGDLTGEAIALETELEILGHYTSPTSEEYTRKKTEYDEILSQLAKLKLESAGSDDDLIRAYIPTLNQVPQVALELLRFRRAVEIETTVYTMLVKEFEKTRIEEARDTPTIQVMDRAAVPNLRSRPKRKMMVIVGAAVGFGWSALLAVFITVWRENKDQSKVFTEVLNPIFSDFSRVFRRNKP